MTPKTLSLEPDLYAYMVAHGGPSDPVLEQLARDTAAMGTISQMQISPEQGALLTMLARLLDAHLIVELGTFTGYSSVCLARGLAPGGRLICCDVSEQFTARARQAWREDGIEDRVELRIGPALQTLQAMPS